jgi:hypothetical protein
MTTIIIKLKMNDFFCSKYAQNFFLLKTLAITLELAGTSAVKLKIDLAALALEIAAVVA